ncbi:MAG: hypothetical protein Q8L95_12530 [Burkholderiales bacterium]|nr:hypothetical protein [Burkholderiales bacterium]
MLGWEFFIHEQRETGAGLPAAQGTALASWKAGLGGTQWLDLLVSKGMAINLGGDGYPNRYAVAAGTILAVLRQGIPKHDGPLVLGDDYMLPSGWTGDASIDIERLELVDPSEILLVEAWDQS